MKNSKDLKVIYRATLRLGKISNSQWTTWGLIILYSVITTIQLISFTLLGVDFNGISFGETAQWRAFAALSTTLIGSAFAVVATIKMTNRKKDFFWWQVLAMMLFMVSDFSLELYLSVIKLMIIQFFIVYQRFTWNKETGNEIQAGSIGIKNTLVLTAVLLAFGFVSGYGMTFVTNKYISYLDGMTFVLGISTYVLLAYKKKEAYIYMILNSLALIAIFVIIGQWASLASVIWLFISGIYGYLNWTMNHKIDSDPQSIYLIKHHSVE